MAKDIRETFGPDSIELKMRDRIRATIETLVNEELDAALGASKSERADERRGYRHGHRDRTITTSLGPTTLSLPRARVGSEAAKREWRSEIVPRYQRRTARIPR